MKMRKRAFSAPEIERTVVKRTTVRVPNQMLEKINNAMALDGWNKKQRSKWVNHYITEFYNLDGAEELVLEECLHKGNNVNIPLIIEENTIKLLSRIETAVLNYEQEDWEIQDRSLRAGDVQSRIIRSAIATRLAHMEAKRIS